MTDLRGRSVQLCSYFRLSSAPFAPSRFNPAGRSEMPDVMAPPIPVVPPPYWTEERERIQTEAREFAMNEVLPLANELDKQKAEIPRWFLDRIGEKRYFGITIPTEYGGLGLGTFEYCMITEELA